MGSYNYVKLCSLIKTIANNEPGEVKIIMKLERADERKRIAELCIDKELSFKISGETVTVLAGW